MSGIRVLLADHHTLLRLGVRTALEAFADIDLIGEATDGRAALKATIELRPDVVLLDVSMPGSGLWMIPHLCAARAEVRVVLFTMYDDSSFVRSALAAGAAGYLIKSATAPELVRAIRTVFRGRSYIDASLAGAQLSVKVELSGREQQVLELLALGHSHKEIAQRLSISVRTVETYRGRLLEKLGLRNRVDLVRYALDNGILQANRLDSGLN